MGKKSPPKEKDYTKERAQFAESAYQDRLKQADQYNTSVNEYNSRLDSYLSDFNNLSNQLNDFSIVDDEKFGSFANTLSDLQRNASSSFSLEKPFFESIVQSPYGAVQVNTPQLRGINTTAQNNLTAGLQSLSSKLQQLQDQRKAEEARIRDFGASLVGQLGGISSALGTAGIGNKSVLDSIQSQLDALNTQRSTFSSDILSEFMPSAFQQFGSQYDLARSSLADLYSRRAAEEQRVKDYQTGLQGQFDNFRDQFGNLSIADEAGINALQQAIDNAQIGAGRFTSELGFNFSPTLMEIQGLEDQLGGLRNERNSELARIQQAQERARQGLTALQSQMGSADIYNLSNLNSLQAAIDAAQSDIGNFTSELDFDFGEFSNGLSAAEADLGELFGQRSSQLSSFQSQLAELLGGVNEADLWNEDFFNDSIGDIQDLQTQANRFAGTDFNDLRFGITDAIRAAQGRLEDLGDYRNDFEGRAQDWLAAINEQPFYTMDDFTAPEAQLAEWQAELEKYGATQGSDELASIDARLKAERSRLAQDLINSSTHSELAQSDVERMLREQQDTGPMTVEQYLQFLQQLEEEEQNPANQGGGFLNNIGVIRL